MTNKAITRTDAFDCGTFIEQVEEFSANPGIDEKLLRVTLIPTCYDKLAAFLHHDADELRISRVHILRGPEPLSPKAQAILDTIKAMPRPPQVTLVERPLPYDNGLTFVLRTEGNVAVRFAQHEFDEGLNVALVKARHDNAVQALRQFAHPDKLKGAQ